MIKYITLASSVFCLSNISVASDSEMKIEKDNFLMFSKTNVISNLDDSFEDEAQEKRFMENKEEMKRASKRVEERLGLDKDKEKYREKMK